MTIPLEGRLWWRRTAPFHVQMELDRARDPEPTSGETRIHGLAVRIFRTDGRLSAGDRVEFSLWVCRRGDEPTGPAFIYEDAFLRAEYIEAYLSGIPPKCQLAAYEFCVLDALSDRPVLTPEELERLEAAAFEANAGLVPKRRGWQFWKRTGGA